MLTTDGSIKLNHCDIKGEGTNWKDIKWKPKKDVKIRQQQKVDSIQIFWVYNSFTFPLFTSPSKIWVSIELHS